MLDLIKTLCVTGLLLFNGSGLLASQSDINTNPKNITEKQLDQILSKIESFYENQNLDSLHYYTDKAYNIVKDINLELVESDKKLKQIADVSFYYGERYYNGNEVLKSIEGYNKAAMLYEKLDEKLKLAHCWNNIGVLFSNIGDEAKCLDYLNRSTSIYMDLQDSVGMAIGFNSLGEFYRRQENFQKTEVYLTKGLEISTALGDDHITTTLLNAKASLKRETEDYEGAIDSYKQALSTAKRAGNKVSKALTLNNLGSIYIKIKEPDQAIGFLNRSNQILNELGFDYGKAFVLANIAEYHLLKNENDKALVVAYQAFELAEVTMNSEGEIKALEVLLKIQKGLENWEEISKLQQNKLEYLDNKNKNLVEQINQKALVRYKLERQKYSAENENYKMLLEQEKRRKIRYYYYTAAIVLFILLAIFLFIFYYRFKTTKEQNKIITKQSEERKLLLQEVHHRVKNNFQIVSSMLRLQSYNFEDEELRKNFNEAVNRINAMAIVHDIIYRQEKFKDIDAANYLERVVQALHKTGDKRINIEVDAEHIPFRIETLINLGIALNELITNSFKHAFDEETVNPTIKISLKRKDNNQLELIYKDNGIGISQESIKTNFGMELIETIIDNLDGTVTLAPNAEWKTLFRIIFKE